MVYTMKSDYVDRLAKDLARIAHDLAERSIPLSMATKRLEHCAESARRHVLTQREHDLLDHNMTIWDVLGNDDEGCV